MVLDPGDEHGQLRALTCSRGGDPDLRTDVLIGALKNIFSDAWGIRSELPTAAWDPHPLEMLPDRPWPTWDAPVHQ